MIRKILAIFMVVMMIVVSFTGCASTPSTGNEEPPKTGGNTCWK